MTVQEKLYEKLQQEYNNFLDNLRSLPSQQIIEAAYEKVIKEEILSIFEDTGLLPDNTAQVLLNKNISLVDLYKGWKNADVNKNEILTESVASMVFDYERDDWLEFRSNPTLMPDTSITVEEMEKYGYNDYSDMLPLDMYRAIELYNQGLTVFVLHADATEVEVEDIKDFERHGAYGGIFGIEKRDWYNSKDFQSLAAQANEQDTMVQIEYDEAFDLYMQEYDIYLLFNGDTEEKVYDSSQIEEHKGHFGIKRVDWLKSKEHENSTETRDDALATKQLEQKEYRTYKAELSLPDDKDLRMEIILADDDEDAIGQAYELENKEGVSLQELHELDDAYNIIREVNLSADPSLRRFMDVDLIDFLGKIADKVIVHYPQDFKHDIEILWKKALLDNPAEQKLMWHCSSYGTHTLNEDEVFTKNTGAYGYWVDYRPNEPDMMGYVIEVTGYKAKEDIVIGNVYEVGEYAQHAAYVRQAALPLESVSLTYSNNWGINAGKTITVPHHVYDKDRHRLMSESGDVVGIKYHPLESQMTMAERLQSEQRNRMCMQIGDTNEHLQKIDDKLAKIRGSSEKNQETVTDIPENEIPVYKDYLDVATEKGEKPLFVASQKLNHECSQAIDRALSENSKSGPMAGTKYVNTEKAINGVIAEYGAERVAWVLAGNIQAAESDGRISQKNKDWAKDYDIPKNSVYHLNAHRTIVDSLVNTFRKFEQERAMPKKSISGKGAEQDKTVIQKKSKKPNRRDVR